MSSKTTSQEEQKLKKTQKNILKSATAFCDDSLKEFELLAYSFSLFD